jgi:hypothetical protein
MQRTTVMKTRNFISGIVAWLGLLTAALLGIHYQFEGGLSGAGRIVGGISTWLSGGSQEFNAESDSHILLAPGDPVFLQTADGEFRQIGRVRNHFGPTKLEAWTRQATVLLYPDQLSELPAGSVVLEYHTAPTSLDSVVTTLLTPERQKEIALLIAEDWKQHHSDVMSKLQPVLERSVIKTLSAIEAELPRVIEAHRGDLARLSDRYQAEMVRRQLVPLVKTEILPIVQEEIRPVAMSVGQELWNRVSLLSFTWRYLYDASPLPERNTLRTEFDRFLVEEVTPVLELRTPEFVAVTERILKRISRNEKVRRIIRDNLKTIAADSELHRIVWDVLQESVLKNTTLRMVLKNSWESPEVQDALKLATTRFEPTARKIGDTIFGSREGGVTAEFAQVLRTQILMKDRRWLIAKAVSRRESISTRTPFRIIPATDFTPYPLRFEGVEHSPLTETSDSPSAPAETQEQMGLVPIAMPASKQ